MPSPLPCPVYAFNTKCECSSLNPHTGEEDRIDKTRKKVLEILAADQEEYSVVFNSGSRIRVLTTNSNYLINNTLQPYCVLFQSEV